MGYVVAAVTGVLLALGSVAAVAQVAGSEPEPVSTTEDIATYGER